MTPGPRRVDLLLPLNPAGHIQREQSQIAARYLGPRPLAALLFCRLPPGVARDVDQAVADGNR